MLRFAAAVALALVVTACFGTARSVTRTTADAQTDLSGRWNDTDARLVAEEMIRTCLDGGWYAEFQEKNAGQKPFVIVGKIINKTTEQIDVSIFIEQMKNQLVNSRKVRFVADARQREEVRAERADQAQGNTNDDTAASIGNEQGANFMLKGALTSTEDRSGGVSAVFYQVNLELIDLTTNEIVWNGQKQIKKIIARADYRA